MKELDILLFRFKPTEHSLDRSDEINILKFENENLKRENKALKTLMYMNKNNWTKTIKLT